MSGDGNSWAESRISRSRPSSWPRSRRSRKSWILRAAVASHTRTRSPIPAARSISSAASANRPWDMASAACATASIHSWAGCLNSPATRVIDASSLRAAARVTELPGRPEAVLEPVEEPLPVSGPDRERDDLLPLRQPPRSGVGAVQGGRRRRERIRERCWVVEPARDPDRLLARALATLSGGPCRSAAPSRESSWTLSTLSASPRAASPSSSKGTSRSSDMACVHRNLPP